MSNIEKLTEKINKCQNRRKIYNMLMALTAEPGFEQIENAADKRSILLSDVVALTDQTKTA